MDSQERQLLSWTSVAFPWNQSLQLPMSDMETEPWKAFGLDLQDLGSRGEGVRGWSPEFHTTYDDHVKSKDTHIVSSQEKHDFCTTMLIFWRILVADHDLSGNKKWQATNSTWTGRGLVASKDFKCGAAGASTGKFKNNQADKVKPPNKYELKGTDKNIINGAERNL